MLIRCYQQFARGKIRIKILDKNNITCRGDNTACLSLIWCLQHQSFGRGRLYQRISRRILSVCDGGQRKRNIQSLYCTTIARTIILCPAVQTTVKDDNWRLRLEGTPEDKREGRSLRAIKRDAGRIHSSSNAQAEEASHRSLRHIHHPLHQLSTHTHTHEDMISEAFWESSTTNSNTPLPLYYSTISCKLE